MWGAPTLPNASSMLAFLVTRLTRMGVRLEPSRSNRPLVKAAADICNSTTATTGSNNRHQVNHQQQAAEGESSKGAVRLDMHVCCHSMAVSTASGLPCSESKASRTRGLSRADA